MRCFIAILLLFACHHALLSQTYEFKNRKFKGAYGDGFVRSEHGFVLDKVTCPAIVCEGDTAVLSIGYEGTFVCRFKWRKVGDSRDSWCNTPVMTFPDVTTEHRGRYYCCLIDVRSGNIRYSDTVELKVRKRPRAIIGEPETPYMQCYGDSTVLSATDSEIDKEKEDLYTYFWEGPDIKSVANQSWITVRPKESATYTVTVDNEGCSADTSIYVEVYRPKVDIPAVIYLAQDQTLTIEADIPSTASVDWKVGEDVVKDMNPLIYNGITKSCNVEVTMTDRGCSVQDEGLIYFKRGRGYKGGYGDGHVRSAHQVVPAKIRLPNEVCEGENATLYLSYEGTTVCRYKWYKIGADGVLSDSASLVLDAVGVADRGRYYCVLADVQSGRTFLSDTAELKIKKRPEAIIGSPSSPKLICYGDTIVLNASASEAGKEAGDEYTYSWGGEGIVSGSNMSLIKVSSQETTVYTVMVGNGSCYADTTVTVIVYQPEVDLPDYMYVSEGNTLELKVDVPDAAKLIWTAEGNVFEDINPFVYPDIRQSMDVSVKMLNEGCEASDSCKVYVKRGRGYQGGVQDGFDRSCVAPVILAQNRSEASCVATGAELWVTAEGSSLKYVWKKFNDDTKKFEAFSPSSNTTVKGLGTNRLSFDPLVMADNGVFLCEIKNECGSVTTDTFSLSVGGLPVMKSGLNKEWEQCVNGLDSTHLNVVALDPQGKDLVYTWFKIDTLTGRSVPLTDPVKYNQPYLKLLLNDKAKDEGLYLVNVHNSCGDTRDSVFIPVNTPVRIVRDGETVSRITACVGGTAEFSITTTGGGKVRHRLVKVKRIISEYPLQYEMDYDIVGGSKISIDRLTKADEGNYVWEVDNGCGKDTLGFISLTVESPPVLIGVRDTTSLCEGDNLLLSCKATSGFSTLKYEWFKDGVSTGVKMNQYVMNSVAARHAGNYVCRVGNSCPPVEGPVHRVVIKERPVVLSQPYIRESYCEGAKLELKAELGSVRVDSMRWYHDGVQVMDVPGLISGSTSNVLVIDSIVIADGGNYRLYAYNGCGKNYSRDARLVVDLPARFVTDLSGYADLVLCDGANQSLTVGTTGTAPIRYIWTHNGAALADGFSNTIQLKNATADTAGLYCCEIQNRCGGRIACAQIKVSHPDTFRFELNSPVNRVCASDPDGLTAVLMGSDTNTLYYLYKEPGVLVKKVRGADILPHGGFIEFNGLMGGTYYVVGEDTRYSQKCSYRMPGTVTIIENLLPLKYNLLVLEHFCKDQHAATLVLTSSQKDPEIEYGLYKLDGTVWNPYLGKIRGTGDTIKWKNIPEGTYKVVSGNSTTGCRIDMNGMVEVQEQAVPTEYELLARGKDSVYCADMVSDVTLELAGRDAETKYVLYRNDVMYRAETYTPLWEQAEAGMYRVSAQNKWGCRMNMGHHKVVAQQAPRQTSITGGFIYCEDQKGTAKVEITETDKSILYRVYSESPKVVYMDTMGTGGPILLKVPLEDKRYYVVAEDTTAEHCRTALSDTAEFRMSRLKVVGNPSEYYLWNGETTTLPITITGQEGQMSVSWIPADKLEAGHNVLEVPTTLPVLNREDFVVTVRDYSACTATATVSVIVKSDKLACDIRGADKATSYDTIRACMGADIDLYAWVDGGTGEYDYVWKDENGNNGNSQSLQGYSRRTDGWLRLEVTSAKVTVKDSVWVAVYPNPKEWRLMNAGLRCVQKSSVAELQLSGSEAGIRYILCYSTDNSRYNEIDTIDCSGGDVIFSIANAYNREGFYRVRAEYRQLYVNCGIRMEGTVEIRKGAELYSVSGGKTYCEGEEKMDTIRVAASQKGIVYTLVGMPDRVLATMNGDGNSLLFAGNFGTGSYRVTAKNGVCRDTLPGVVSVVRNPLPKDYGILENESYCVGSEPSRITLNNTDIGVIYRLMENGVERQVFMGDAAGTRSFTGPFGPGIYRVTAEVEATGCARMFARGVKIAGELQQVVMEAYGIYCESEKGYGGRLKIGVPQVGVTYELYTEAGILKGVFDSLAVSGLYYTGLLEAGNYRVQAVAGECRLDMTQPVVIEMQTLPENQKLTAPFTLCEGDGLLAMNITGGATYRYELYRNSGGVETLLKEVAGVNGAMNLGEYGVIGDYRVMAIHGVTGCRWQLPGQFHIDKALKEFKVYGDTLYCASEAGVVIGMEGTENNIAYVLQKWDDTFYEYKEVDRLTGKGMPVAFKGYFPAGNYQVKAVRGCEKLMDGQLVVNSKPVPADSTTVVLEGNGCADSAVIIRVNKSEPDVTYTLYHDGEKWGESLKGSDLKWNIGAARLGVYKVTADKGGCLFTFPDYVEIGERPFVTPLSGDSLLCANLYGELYMKGWDPEAAYTLYDMQGKVVAEGSESGDKLYFSGVSVGRFYPVAARGNCEVKGDTVAIDSIAVPVFPDSFWQTTECVGRGQGEIVITGMADTLHYVLTGNAGVVLLDYKGSKADTVFRNLEFGQYCIVAEDAAGGCRSDELCVEIREKVSDDSLTGDFAYCGNEPGVRLRLSGSSNGMIYRMLTEDGDLIEELRNGETEFTKNYRKGVYVFHKERGGFLGGCFVEDTVRIDSFGFPNPAVEVEMENGSDVLCAGGNYKIGLKNTELGFRYILIKDPGTVTEQWLDTLAGSEGKVVFVKDLKEKGFYRIYAEPVGGLCGAYLDTTFRLYGVPKPVKAVGCNYCVAEGEKDSCVIGVSSLSGGVMYALYHDGMALDTLYGPGQGTYRPAFAGNYQVMGTDRTTGCSDTVAVAEIREHKLPNLFTVSTVCAASGEIGTTDGSDGDTVSYYLYRNGVQVGEPVKGTGHNISFGAYSDYGTYKIKAVSSYGCERWMRDSATLYAPLTSGQLTQNGFYCKDGETGVTVTYSGALDSWGYFLKKGMWSTDTLSGKAGTLSWDKIEDKRILSAGTYNLYASNACETRQLNSLKVEENPLPQVFKLEGKDAAICSGTGVEIILKGSQELTTYQVAYVNSGKEQVVKTEAGNGYALVLGNYSAIGQYVVYAIVDSSGCRAKMDEKMFYPGAVPDIKNIAGKDICLNAESEGVMNICISGVLQSKVDYYLRLQGDKVGGNLDTLSTNVSGLCFKAQREVGCYMVVARDSASGCENVMEGQFCLGLPPEEFAVKATADTVTLCRGEEYGIVLDGSNLGVKYILLRDGIQQGKAVAGDGWEVTVGNATESGVYKVKAFVDGDCWLMMKDSVIVKVNELPGMLLQKEYAYCAWGCGVTLGVKAPTESGFTYVLKSPEGITLESRGGNADRSGFEFSVAGQQKEAGYYRIEVAGASSCLRADSVKVTVNPLPASYPISSPRGEWLCVGGEAELYVDSSQMGVEYRVYRKLPDNVEKEIGRKYGTGRKLLLTTVYEAGEYYVKGINYTTTCENNMLNRIVLNQADTVKVYRLEGVRTGYCYTDDIKGSVRLQKSKVGVTYHLYRDGRITGQVQEGTGEALLWTGLEGNPCSNKVGVNDVGALYEVMAHDVKTGCEAWMNGKVGIVEESDPTVLAWHPNKDILRCSGQNVVFNLSATGCNLSYQWKRNGVVVKDTLEEFYNIDSITMVDFGTYYCEVSNSCGTAMTPQVRLNVRDSLEYLKRMEDRAVCGNTGEAVVLTGYIRNGQSYEWHKLGNDTPLSYSEWYKIRSVLPEHAGVYVFRAANECWTLTDTMELKIDADPLSEPVVFRTDTICAGEPYRLHVASADTVKWYRDGVFTGVRGNDYILNRPVAVDEGLYTVQIANACGRKEVSVARLYVDDTIRVVSLRPSEVVCENSMVDLYIRTMPEKRVSYTWTSGGVVIARDRNTYRAGPMTSKEPEYAYWINYRNKCTNESASIRLSVSDKLDYKDPEPNIRVCASEQLRDTAIFVTHPATLIASYQWYWQEFKNNADPVKLEGEVYDTLRIAVKTANIGYYYCEIGKVCNPVTTQSCWFRVDSIPVIHGLLGEKDTVCRFADRRFELPATGGGLTYEWNLLLKDGTTESHAYTNSLYASTGYYDLTGIEMKYDSCRIWCRVYNDCEEVWSDTLLLRVNPLPSVTVTPTDTTLCEYATAKVALRLTKGTAPWSFRYRSENDTTRTGYALTDVDSMVVTVGRNTLELVKDKYCEASGELAVVNVAAERTLKVELESLLSEDTICVGTEVPFRITLTDGVGPWKITLTDTLGNLAEELGLTYPYTMTTREEQFRFIAMTNNKYIVAEVLDLGAPSDAVCAPHLGGSLRVIPREMPTIGFRLLSDNHFGSCTDIDLDTLLCPQPAIGHYTVNGVRQDGSLWVGAVGCDTVGYVIEQGGCISEHEILLWREASPSAELTLPAYICPGGTGELVVGLNVPNCTFRVERTLESMLSSVVSVVSVTAESGEWKENIAGLPGDTCLIYRISALTDRFGCQVDTTYSDTVRFAQTPSISVSSRCPASAEWDASKQDYVLHRGDSLSVKVDLNKGLLPWTLHILKREGGTVVDKKEVTGIGTGSVDFYLKGAGDYHFGVSDKVCDSPSWIVRRIEYADTGYIRVQAFLEGPYNSVRGEMSVGKAYRVPLSGLTGGWLPSVIDWVELSLRQSATGEIAAENPSAEVFSGRYLLLSDGTLVDTLGRSVLALPGLLQSDTDAFFVLLRHRNHLGVMNAVAVAPSRTLSLAPLVNFKSGRVWGGAKYQMTCLPDGEYSLSAGNFDKNELISIRDVNSVFHHSGTAAYSRYDINFDGVIDWPGVGTSATTDWDICIRNRDKFCPLKW